MYICFFNLRLIAMYKSSLTFGGWIVGSTNKPFHKRYTNTRCHTDIDIRQLNSEVEALLLYSASKYYSNTAYYKSTWSSLAPVNLSVNSWRINRLFGNLLTLHGFILENKHTKQSERRSKFIDHTIDLPTYNTITCNHITYRAHNKLRKIRFLHPSKINVL